MTILTPYISFLVLENNTDVIVKKTTTVHFLGLTTFWTAFLTASQADMSPTMVMAEVRKVGFPDAIDHRKSHFKPQMCVFNYGWRKDLPEEASSSTWAERGRGGTTRSPHNDDAIFSKRAGNVEVSIEGQSKIFGFY